MGRAMALMENLNPNRDIIQAVTVVPMLAPIITPMDCEREISPALTKLTSITVVAELDCTTAVIIIPVRIPLKRFEVIAVRMERILSPATFCNDSLSIFIPKRNSPSEPNSCNS